MKTELLIDGDVFIYRAASKAERVFDWDNEIYSLVADMNEAKGHLESELEELRQTLKADEVRVCVSDPRRGFRHQIYPEYKANRKGRKPIIFRQLREWTVDQGAVMFPMCEGDDVMGILATQETTNRRIMVTIDKDLRSVPGEHYNPDKPDQGIYQVSKEEAELFHLCQTIAGDPTDNYPGVPGLGMVRAEKALKKLGATWDTVVSLYTDNNLSEEFALTMARLAKILTASEWNESKEEVILWNPR